MAAFKLSETKGNLFHTSPTFSLAHSGCADGRTVKGTLEWQIALIFGESDTHGQQLAAGSLTVLEHDSRFVYKLVLKQQLCQMGDYNTLQEAVICMREHMRNHGVTKVAMPRIGCGNNRLDWQRVKAIIHDVFDNEHNVEIMVIDRAHVAGSKCEIVEVRGNIFSAPKTFSLVHSVSADFALCKGIALQFKCKFGHINELAKQNKHAGNVAMLQDGDRYVYNLITKERNHDRCTYPALYNALLAMREHMNDHNVRQLAVPRIGCGIDRLSWLRVKDIFRLVFADDDVEIVFFLYEPPAVAMTIDPNTTHTMLKRCTHCDRYT